MKDHITQEHEDCDNGRDLKPQQTEPDRNDVIQTDGLKVSVLVVGVAKRSSTTGAEM